jgi:hypothetical protein
VSQAKPVNWGKRPSKKAEDQKPATKVLDSFVNPAAAPKPTKRLNADIPATLHARVKAGCAMEGRDITEVLIELLASRFPEK